MSVQWPTLQLLRPPVLLPFFSWYKKLRRLPLPSCQKKKLCCQSAAEFITPSEPCFYLCSLLRRQLFQPFQVPATFIKQTRPPDRWWQASQNCAFSWKGRTRLPHVLTWKRCNRLKGFLQVPSSNYKKWERGSNVADAIGSKEQMLLLCIKCLSLSLQTVNESLIRSYWADFSKSL